MNAHLLSLHHVSRPASLGWGRTYIPTTGFGSSVRQKGARTAALPFALRRRVLVVISRKAVGFVDNISGTFVPHSAYSDINSILWDLIDFGRGGRRGYSQKAAFIRGGLQQGFRSNSYPHILDESQLGRATFRKPVIQQEYEAQHQSTASSSRLVRSRLEDDPKTFNLSSTPGAGGTWLLWTPDPEFIFR